MTSTILKQIFQRSSTVDELFNQEYRDRITDFTEDPLVLSCALQSVIDTGNGWHSLESETVKQAVTDEIRDKAEKIREYYSKKFFWATLSSSRALSDYRQRLLNLLENRIRSCNDKDVGIYFKLPFFYMEDQVYDKFKKIYQTDNLQPLQYSTKECLDLQYLESTFSTQRKNKIERFWFTDQKYLYQIELDQSNPLLEMFKSLLEENKKSFKLETNKYIDQIDNMQFFKLVKFKFTKE